MLDPTQPGDPPPPLGGTNDDTPFYAKVNHLKRELRDLSAGAIKLEEASFVVASASLACRKRGVESAAAGGGGGGSLASAVTKLGERRAKSAAIVSRYAVPAGKGPGRGSLVSSAGQPPRTLRARPEDHSKWGRNAGGGGEDRADHFPPMGWNRDWEERGTTGASAAGTDTRRTAVGVQPDAEATTMTREVVGGGVLEQEPLGVQKEAAGASGAGGDESRGAKPDEVDREENEVATEAKYIQMDVAAAAAAVPETTRKYLRPCPLAGILDMSEPPIHGHRRSYYNEGDGNVYLVPRTSEERTVASLTEPQREEERFKCVIDFQGVVRHGEDCSLRDVAHKAALPQKKKQSFSASKRPSLDNPDSVALDRGSDQDPLPISIGIPIRTWHRDGSSDWNPSGVGGAGEMRTLFRRSLDEEKMRGRVDLH